MEKQLISETNLLLIDWLTFTSKIYDQDSIIAMLQLDDVDWEHCQYGRYGYQKRMVFQGVNVMWCGQEDADGKDLMGVCIEISGQGCRTLETFSGINWLELFKVLMDPDNEFNITRLDLAFDDHTGVLDKLRLKIDTDVHYYRSRFRSWEIRYGSSGFSIYHGSKQSLVLIRIYDKAAERGILDGTHWIRVELQLRDANASGAIAAYLEHQDLGCVYSGILANYLTYVEEDPADSNKGRWPVADYWNELIKGAAAIHIAATPGTEYNIFRLERFLRDTAGGGLQTWIQIFGLDALPDLLKQRRSKLQPKYNLLLQQYGRL